MALGTHPRNSREVNEARWPHTCSGPYAFEEKEEEKKRGKKIRPAHNTPRNPQQPGDRVHVETACEETRPARHPTLTIFHRSRVVEIGLVQLSQSVLKTTNVTHAERLIT